MSQLRDRSATGSWVVRPLQFMCGAGPPAASSTAARHSRLTGRTGGIGAVSGTSVGAAIETMRFDSVLEALRMNVLSAPPHVRCCWAQFAAERVDFYLCHRTGRTISIAVVCRAGLFLGNCSLALDGRSYSQDRTRTGLRLRSHIVGRHRTVCRNSPSPAG
jgi:hypothetical protein